MNNSGYVEAISDKSYARKKTARDGASLTVDTISVSVCVCAASRDFRSVLKVDTCYRIGRHTVFSRLDWTGLDWTGLDWTGLD